MADQRRQRQIMREIRCGGGVEGKRGRMTKGIPRRTYSKVLKGGKKMEKD